MRRVSCLYIILICGTLPAVAAAQAQSAPVTPTTQPSSTTPTPSRPASATPPASSAPSSNPGKPQPPPLTDDEKKLISQGYRAEVHDGGRIFCRREIVVGSHFEKKVCGTADQLASSRQTSREVTESTQRYGTNPSGH